MNKAEREQCILDNINLVRYIASKYYTESIGIEYEDLVSYGTMGLIDAANKYEDDRNCKFSTFASMKIKASIIDEIRRRSAVSRNDVANINKYNYAVKELQNNLFREPTELEIAKFLRVSTAEIHKIENNIHLMSTTSLDTVIFQGNNDITLVDTLKAEESSLPDKKILEDERVEILAKAIDMLKEKDKLVLSLYYYEELNLKEIGRILEVSESRVCQLHSRAIVNLRNAMNKLNYNIA
ncbi:RNA polymerase sigma factor for flagellar operon FliA [Clostridium collagenovorans DSM 3089]|uniref:RNA polymerase sigma factor n=1 Tax=Clostridium collagenovorans DSM 3089 TaxID=1121306 RepID=A0A1M5WQZ0_9CLOT|nr:FliA/WhiG family RNA polymerase sigma factor [Clostridium collagenovorans]SHH89919.1 RNA polymerase sigma factor for flagellar operon FliA [Clostridium collagenovorans DSM 3089]